MAIPSVPDVLRSPTLETPMDLQTWFNHWLEVYPDSDLRFKRSAESQIMRVRDNLPRLARGRVPEWEVPPITVVGCHVSKSVPLPVYCFDPVPGMRIILRGNFHDWNASVVSGRPLELEPDWVNPQVLNDVPSWGFEGFPDQMCFGSYAESNHMTFSCAIFGWEHLVIFLYDLLRA